MLAESPLSDTASERTPTHRYAMTAMGISTTSLDTSHSILIILAGLFAGIFNGVAGGGSLLSFPVLLALGYPALTANITNTIGIWPGYLGSTAGFRAEIADQGEQLAHLSLVAIGGAMVGAILLLTTSSAIFTQLAPWLILGAVALFSAQPLLKRVLNNSTSFSQTRPLLLKLGTFLASVYGGYFGAGLGVMLLAIIGLSLPDSITRTSGLRSVLSMLVNGVAAIVFLIHGGLAWGAAALLATGSLAGGWIGARAALTVPSSALRAAVILIGLGTSLRLLA